MARNTGTCGVYCSSCGKNTGDDSGATARCGSCGRFAEKLADYCKTHEIHWGSISGYDHCPRCRQEQDRQQLIQELHSRRADPNMHPTVDARRR